MKLKSKTTATLLIALFMISAFAVAVNALEPGITLTMGGEGIAKWCDAVPVTLSDGIELYIPTTVQAEYDAGQYDEARVVFSYGNDLDSIDSISYNSYVVSGMEGEQHPYVTMAVDTGGDPSPDAWVVQLVVPNFGAGAWGLTTITDASLVHVAATQPGTPPPQGGSWNNQDPGAATATGQTLGNLKLTDFGAFTVVEVKVMNGEIVFTEPVLSYVDDVTINGKLYDFESDAAVGMTVLVEEAPVVSIGVDPTSVDFDTIIQGGSSAVKSVTITNTGNVGVDVTYSIVEDEAFYATYLSVTNVPCSIPDEGFVQANLQLVNVAELGEYTGTLVFWAEAT